MKEEIIVESLAEVVEPEVKYILKSNPARWLKIEIIQDYPHSPKEYCINGPFGLYSFVTHGNRVRTWKTLKGAIGFLRKKSVDPSSGLRLQEWAIEEDKKTAAKAQEEAKEKRRQEMEERKQRYDSLVSDTQALAEFLQDAGLEILSESISTYFLIEYQGKRFEINRLPRRDGS